ncbi:MAG TPA: sulfurtransferase [Candidatus Sulfomarinibacteraceae bacterium]|nr:sulfurtransferase [Candidatus Sulfomarinibacteraceae bacterium]
MRSPIVSPETLAAWLAEERLDVRVVDVRWYLGQPRGTGRAAYDAGHIPGAIHVDLDTDLVAAQGPGRHPLPDPTDFTRTMAGLGIGDGDTVVVYDDVGGWVAARLWWMFEDLGFGADERGCALVLDGGLPAWIAAGLPTTTDVLTLPAAELHLAPNWRRVIDREALKPLLGAVILLDARGGPRYRGEIEPIDPLPGHIPTALHAPTDGNLGTDGHFLSAAELAGRFASLRIQTVAAGMPLAADPASPVITSCGSGVSACHNALAMRIAGLPDPIVYPGSYSDWSRAGEPVAVGPEPGVRPG